MKAGGVSLESIVVELNKPGRSDRETIEAVLCYCPREVQLKFLLRVCESVEHLMKDERSRAVIPELKRCLADEFRPLVDTAAHAAAAANAAAYAANAAAYAANAAAYAAYAAANAAANAAAYAANAAAYAAYAAAYAAANAAAVAYAAAAADAAYAATAVAYAAAADRSTTADETLRELLLTLKEIILECLPEAEKSELLTLVL